MANYKVTDTDLTDVADAIRAKSGASSALEFPDEFISEIENISGGGVQSDWAQSDSSSDDYIKNKPSLATVATSGSYGDLSNKPTIPDALADLSSDSTHRTVTDTEKNTWNDKVDEDAPMLKLDTSAASGTTDGDLYAAIVALSWQSEVIE